MASRISMACTEIRHTDPVAAPHPLRGSDSRSVHAGSRAHPPVAPDDALRSAWEANPRCLECGESVRTMHDAALVVGPDRITHRDRCFVPALLRANPQLASLGIASRAVMERTGELPPSRAKDRWDRDSRPGRSLTVREPRHG
jgi:hypothetical protein